jgi:hypothetical protein
VSAQKGRFTLTEQNLGSKKAFPANLDKVGGLSTSGCFGSQDKSWKKYKMMVLN